ncbi:phage tail terminator protein [Acinetobacter ursingii]|uniref:Uncharacterized protein n=1 Tax=Acinetobacter ursingii TaxID=108980 RepID=A0A3D2SSY7_9GAMM|nr:hypothetical protein [Acinetobacter ursingii]MCH2004042.1 hypothetical protein [Acinetobacter ursingii]MCU4608209.1 hypothetical protein [Acinetobacter ursingii]HCK31804.1 hypothetical protein [Acinetobacter ursingii]
MSNFFAVRDEIAEKLKEISALKQIYTPLNSVKVTEMSQVTPAAHVNFQRITKVDSSGNSKVNMLGIRWAVTVACRNAQSQMTNGNVVTDEAGELLQDVIELLSGWQPSSSVRPLDLIEVREGFSTGFAYLTAIFESKKFI